MKQLIIVLLMSLTLMSCSSFSSSSIKMNEFKNGDIIFQTSLSSQSQYIQLATNSKYSHLGVVYQINDQWYVYEAIQPVQLTPLDLWIKRGENKHFVLKRLKNSVKILTN